MAPSCPETGRRRSGLVGASRTRRPPGPSREHGRSAPDRLRYAPSVKSPSSHPRAAPAVLDALPLAVVGVDGALRVVVANAAARATRGAAAGTSLGDALGCAEARAV